MSNMIPSSFFITNDHYFWGGFLGGVLRKLENKFGPWKWASDIVYCSATGSQVDCKSVSPTHSHPSANGALLIDDGKTLLVNDVVEATTTFYDVDPVSKNLSVKRKVVRRLLNPLFQTFLLTSSLKASGRGSRQPVINPWVGRYRSLR